jgi:hypothetical protein
MKLVKLVIRESLLSLLVPSLEGILFYTVTVSDLLVVVLFALTLLCFDYSIPSPSFTTCVACIIFSMQNIMVPSISG